MILQNKVTMACLKAEDVFVHACICARAYGPKRKHVCILTLNIAVFR